MDFKKTAKDGYCFLHGIDTLVNVTTESAILKYKSLKSLRLKIELK